MNKREEDYIKTIYTLTVEEKAKLANTQVVANTLEVTIQTANEMFKKLAKQDLVVYKPYKGVRLTEKGITEAIRVIRAHRIIELFLTETLNFKWSEVYEDAERLEHAASVKLVDALYEFLGRPKTDPHGHPIPVFGEEYKISTLNLFALNKNDGFKIIMVNESDDVFNYFDNNKIKIADDFVVEYKDENAITIKSDRRYQISKNIAVNIFVEKLKKEK